MLIDQRDISGAARWALLSVVLGVAAALGPSPVNAQDPAQALEQSLTKVIEQAEPAVVSIAKIRVTKSEITIRPLNQPLQPFRQQNGPPTEPEDPDYQPNGFGAGVLITGVRANDRVVLTNYHVVQGGPVFTPHATDATGQVVHRPPPYREVDGVSTKLFIRFADRRSCYASILAADPRSDLAVLALELEESQIDAADLRTLDWKASTAVKKGQLVVMLGNPYGVAYDGSASASWGMISNVARLPLPWSEEPSSRTKLYRLGNLIQIDGRLNLGASGGPLLNLKGELIGLTTSLTAIEGYEKSAGFATPIDDLTRRVVESLVAGHEVEYGVLGIGPAMVTPSSFRELNTGLKQASAAKVTNVTADSPAKLAGIEVDDVILSVGDFPVYSDHDLMRIVGLHAPDSKVDIGVWRKGRTLRLKARLGKWPVQDDENIIETTPRYSAWRGISVDYPTGRHKYHQHDGPFRRAVVVTKAEGPAQAAGLQPGTFIMEVNKIPVQTPAEFAEATKSARGTVELKLVDGSDRTSKVMLRE